MRKKVYYEVTLFNDDFTPFNFVTSTLMHVLGWEITQAVNCATIAHDRGSIVLVSCESIKEAFYIGNMLEEKGLTVTIEESI